MRLPTATYRLQLRNGVTFATVAQHLRYFADLGVSHLHLSPVFTAVAQSTHGYDVTNPAEIEPGLGGRAGFSRLAASARAQGIGIILDIVPNHTAFSVQNPWLCDVLRHGQASGYAGHFDIDWSRGKLVLPFLSAPLEAMLAAGDLGLAPLGNGWAISDGKTLVPLAPGPVPPAHLHRDADALRAVLAAQVWRLSHWETERDAITHRRFFNVTGLIGMRVEDPAVFDDTHALVFDLIGAGEVQGLRIDHIDGLADPAAYLQQLRGRVGDLPIWVEKILTGDEALPDWPVQGTTGYEVARQLARVLTDAEGLARLDTAWRQDTGLSGTFHATLEAAKSEVMRHDLAAELHQLIGLVRAALEGAEDAEAGDEAIREALLALLRQFPRYRTYFTAATCRPEDEALMQGVAEQAVAGLRSGRVATAIADRIARPETPAAMALQRRFQQVTGALLAKSHEDTAGFRWSRFLAANEVGADPDDPTLGVAAFSDWLGQRAATAPHGLTLTSSHDTKRSEDARMRLVAASHLPDALLSVLRHAATVPGAAAIEADLRWYIVQSALAIWTADCRDLETRLTAHVEKAMREAKLVTNWSHPDPEAENGPLCFAGQLIRSWQPDPPEGVAALIARGEQLSLMQLALKLTMPGIPEIYQGTESGAFHLTDPDNRRAVDFAALERGGGKGRFDALKNRMTRDLLGLRRAHPAFFASAGARLDDAAAGALHMLRESGEDWLSLTVDGSRLSLHGTIGAQAVAISQSFDAADGGCPGGI